MGEAVATGERQAVPGELRERRLFRRYPKGMAARLRLDGEELACRLCDISLGGAGIEPALPEALGDEVELSSPGFPFTIGLVGRVVACWRYGTHIAFRLDEAAEAALAGYLAGHGRAP